MESLNSLLIIASAFSVFGQYIDNNHRSEIEAEKNKIDGWDLSESLHNNGFAVVKEKIDDFKAKECLRATTYVKSLFVYLATIVATIAGYHASQVIFVLSESQKNEATNIVTTFFGVVLFFIAWGMGHRLKGMLDEKRQAKTEVLGLKGFYDIAKATLDSQKEKTAGIKPRRRHDDGELTIVQPEPD